MIDYMVLDTMWKEYSTFASEEQARDYVKKTLDRDPSSSITDFIIFKRERIEG